MRAVILVLPSFIYIYVTYNPTEEYVADLKLQLRGDSAICCDLELSLRKEATLHFTE